MPADAAGHELRQPDGAGIGAPPQQRIDLTVAAEQQELLEFFPKESGAARVLEGKRGQGVHHPEIAGVAAIDRLDADDRHDDLLRHAKSVGGAPDRIGLFSPEA